MLGIQRPHIKARILPRLTVSFTKDCHLSQQVRSTRNRPIDTSSSHYFNYTSGRWLINEAHQLQTRHVNFNVPALQRIAGQLMRSRCVQMDKMPEGLFNKVFSLQMENGKEILARIPNPNAGHAHYVVASEVATLDFVRWCQSSGPLSPQYFPDMQETTLKAPNRSQDTGPPCYLVELFPGGEPRRC